MPSAWLYYSSPSKVFSNEGIDISSEEGAQQGDHVGNWAFSMVAKFINDRLSCLKLALKLFYVDDLLLIGDLRTLNAAIGIFKELEELTGIQINLSKTTLYCRNEEIYTKATKVLGETISIENTMNVVYLKCPIGDDQFVRNHLEAKLLDLRRITKILGEMLYLHEAWTSLRYCGADARVNHLQRVIPPTQMKWFNEKYDLQIREAYSHLLRVSNIPNWSWKIQKLTPRLGGIMLRTEKGLSAVKYSESLARSVGNISTFIEKWDPVEVFTRDAWRTLESDLDADIDPKTILDSLIISSSTGKNSISGIVGLEAGKDSLLRITELRSQNRVFENLSESEKLWITANSGETQTWTPLLPLSPMDNALTNYEFWAIFKRIARLPVYPGPQKCVNCTNLTADIFGDHTLRCENKTERHNFVCARLKMVLENCGCKVLVEQGATYHNLRRSGDLMVQNWKPGVDLYIDVSVIDPNGESWRNDLLVGGSGEAARKKEAEKRDYYRKHFKLIDKRHEFMPFIIEAQGGVGSTVLKLISTLLKRKKELCLCNISRTVKRRDICGGEMLKILFLRAKDKWQGPC